MINIYANIILHFILYAIPKLSGKKTVWKHCNPLDSISVSRCWFFEKTDSDWFLKCQGWISNFATTCCDPCQLAVTHVICTCHLEDFCQQTITWNSQDWLLTLEKLCPDEQIGMGFVSALYYCWIPYGSKEFSRSICHGSYSDTVFFNENEFAVPKLHSYYSCHKPLLLWKKQIFHACGECIGEVEICVKSIFCSWRPVLLQLFWTRLYFASATETIDAWIKLQSSVLILCPSVSLYKKKNNFALFCNSKWIFLLDPLKF